MDRFSIALNKKPSEPKKPSKEQIDEVWEKFAETNQQGSDQEWIQACLKILKIWL
jgi:hypothetical protein